ncbi:hypothetical protein KGF57_000625 [Candida theae]|uniref:CBM21 domain-containing protein n=1 Tax=Candida theae TaxID=1198502 RepID=A0AAD5G0J4_9ASCO|nr:uncharacterized protein KGF57_000625 [Candida theae]KAI5966661.1 hypothetical protein KGF57_000625 [Candida theae]
MATAHSAYTRSSQSHLGDTHSNDKSPASTSASISPQLQPATTSHSKSIGDTAAYPTTAPPPSSSREEATPRGRQRSFTYEAASPHDDDSSEALPSSPTPLSMAFMHKPSRSQSFFTQSNDRTRENSIFNKNLSSYSTSSSSSPKQHSQNQQQQVSDTRSTTRSSDTVSSSPSSSSSADSSASTSQSDKSPSGSPLISPSLVKSPPPPPPSQSPTLDDQNEHTSHTAHTESPDYFNHKSALKSVKRSKSLPSTPTFKVHFGNSDIRYFKKKDTPRTISASNSPTFGPQAGLSDDDDEDVDDDDDDEDDGDGDGYYDNDDYGTFGTSSNYGYRYSDEDDVDDDVKRISLRGGGAHRLGGHKHDHDLHDFSLGNTKYPKPAASSEIQWDLQLLNFEPLSYMKRIEAGTPVFLERLFISADKKYLLGHIAVRNLAFEKYLTVRYSVDNWMTIIEIPTTYTADRADVLEKNNYDRFVFKIPLENLFNTFKMSKNSSTDSLSEDSSSSYNSGDVFRGSSYGDYQKERRYQLCIKYCAQGHEYWDNNRFRNYLVKLVKSRVSHHQPPLAPQQKHHFYNLENKDSQLQDHNRRPRYSSSYLKRVESDSGINYNNPGVDESRDGGIDEEDNDDSDTITMDVSGGSSTIRENIEELLKNTGDAQIKSNGSSSSSNNNKRNQNSTGSSSKPSQPRTGITNDPEKSSANLQVDLDLDSLDTVTTTTPKYKSKFITNQFNLNSNSTAKSKGNLSTGRSNAFNSDLKSKSYKEILDSYCFFKSNPANANGSGNGSGGSGSD